MPPSSDGAVERVVVLPKPLHARPAGQLARLAGRHKETTIQLVAGAKKANARGVLAVMAMGAVTGTEVTLTVTGPDAEAVADEVADILTAAEAVDG
ncbi:phosphocarrier protein HPr/phosphocarrier protein [Asanoa ishikariensis]|uniref:Phosphocarrier protein HPr/phosphocarrier protein n=1 Tax=Asanoa ishikariensis TaxID=137265 RepID=A0A1H3MVB2_9ACTN|nr:HPr family phosphocarrier protein [Asanoa ishikariensis]SDY80662.1 phosphocarrier protein HPr/phosphocarrier protein [Asanoa ishikariensis]